MAGYQILSQLQGPQIDVNLFPQAMLAGTQASKINPGTWGAIGQGVQQGISNFLDTYSGFQQIDLNEQKIKAVEAQTKILEHQADPAQLGRQDEAADIGLETARIKRDQTKADWESTQADLPMINKTRTTQRQAQQEGAEADLAIRQGYSDVNEALKDPNRSTEELSQMFLGQSYADVFRANPQIQLDGLQKLMDQANAAGDVELADQAAAAYDDVLTLSTYKSDYRKNANKWEKDINDAVNDKLMNRIQPETLGYTRQQALQVLRPVERGSIEMVGESNIPKINPDGSFVESKGFLPGMKSDTLYDLYLPDPRNPKSWRSVGTAREDQLEKITNGISATANMSGRAVRAQMQRNRQHRAGAMQANKAPYAGAPAVGPGSPAASPKQQRVEEAAATPGFKGMAAAAQESFKVDAPTIRSIEPELKNIDKAMLDYQNDTSFRISNFLPWGGFSASKADADKIVDTIGSREFERDPSWQRKAGQDRLDEWNRRRERVKNMSFLETNPQRIDHIYPPYKNPKELYMHTRRQALFAQLDNVVKVRMEKLQEERKQLLAPPNPNATFIQQNAR